MHPKTETWKLVNVPSTPVFLGPPARKLAKGRGVKIGRAFKLTAHQRREAIARRDGGELLTEIARSYNVSDSTISRLKT